MAVKTLLSVSLLFWQLLFCSDCGLQGVKASPFSETSANRLDALRTLYPKKTSIINETLSEDPKADPKVIQLVELHYDGVDFPEIIGSVIELSAAYSDGWVVASVYANITWLGTLGEIVLSGGPGQEYWAIAVVIPEGLIALSYEIDILLGRVVPDKTTAAAKAEPIPVEQVFRFDGSELMVKAPPEVRQEISYSNNKKNK